MQPTYPIKKYIITYDYDEQQFYMHNSEGGPPDLGDNGRELGRDAWDMGADEVVYNYDLGLDEHIPLRPRHGRSF